MTANCPRCNRPDCKRKRLEAAHIDVAAEVNDQDTRYDATIAAAEDCIAHAVEQERTKP